MLKNQTMGDNPIIKYYPKLLSATNTTANCNLTTDITVGAIDHIYDTNVEEIFIVQVSKNETTADKPHHELLLELWEFKDTVTNILPPKTGTHAYNHTIELKPHSHSLRLPPYRLTPLLEKKCKKIIQELSDKVFIIEGGSISHHQNY